MGSRPAMSKPEVPIYLDYNATTPVRAEVFDAMRPWLDPQAADPGWGNPSSAHAAGRRAARAVAEARTQVAALIGAKPHEIVFTSGGTEADNLAVFGLAPQPGVRALSSAIEHPAVEAAIAQRVRSGARWSTLATTPAGRVDVDDPLLRQPCDLLTVILAHNETGVIQPVSELAERVRAVNPEVRVHTDAAQAVGKIPIDVNTLGVDALTIVGHKLYAPKGVGALFVREGVSCSPRLFGGGQESGLRPGTEAVHQIVALGAACACAMTELESFGACMAELKERLWNKLHAAHAGLHRTVDPATPCLPNTLHLCVPNQDGREILARAPGLAASTGSACHADLDAVPGVLGAMGLPAHLARGALRLSLGRGQDEAAIDEAARRLAAAIG